MEPTERMWELGCFITGFSSDANTNCGTIRVRRKYPLKIRGRSSISATTMEGSQPVWSETPLSQTATAKQAIGETRGASDFGPQRRCHGQLPWMASMTIAAARTVSFGTPLASSINISYRSRAENCPSIDPTWFSFASVISYLCGIHPPNGNL